MFFLNPQVREIWDACSAPNIYCLICYSFQEVEEKFTGNGAEVSGIKEGDGFPRLNGRQRRCLFGLKFPKRSGREGRERNKRELKGFGEFFFFLSRLPLDRVFANTHQTQQDGAGTKATVFVDAHAMHTHAHGFSQEERVC